ncbi:MAG: MptD family putative ECF transporter S component, partial [Anaerococcus vaginalis]|nr:MptD family putative ECF transporter S component [Anaerococcus vaginalis]
MNETKLKTKDLVNIGIFSVIYMALSMAVMFIPVFSPILWLLWPAMTGIICNFI